MKRILVTAFEPFGGDPVNPTESVLRALPFEIPGARIEKLLLPVEFGLAPELLLAGYRELLPDAVVCFGQAGGRSAVTPELYAVNLMNARMPDNSGFMPSNVPVIKGGEERLVSRLPVWEMIARIRGEGLPAEISFSAGEFVCNCLMYSALALIPESVPAGFVHVPFIKEQVEGVPGREGKPFMELGDAAAAALLAIEALADRSGF